MNKNTTTTNAAGATQSAITAESLTIAINRMRAGEYGDGIRARFDRQGGPLQWRTLCRAAGIAGDYERAKELSGFYFSR